MSYMRCDYPVNILHEKYMISPWVKFRELSLAVSKSPCWSKYIETGHVSSNTKPNQFPRSCDNNDELIGLWEWVSEWVSEWDGLFGDQGPCKPFNINLHIGTIILAHIDDTQSTDHN